MISVLIYVMAETKIHIFDQNVFKFFNISFHHPSSLQQYLDATQKALCDMAELLFLILLFKFFSMLSFMLA